VQPFEGVKVIDATHVLAGPFATYQLAVLGADVIKVEKPDRPDMVRGGGINPQDNRAGLGTHYLAQNANKRSLALDFSIPAGREVLLRLIHSADVLVENFSPGTMERLDLRYDVLARENPRLIYCAMRGFAAKSPYGSRSAYDNVIQAISGMMSLTGTADTGPLKSGAPVIDYATGLQAAFAIASALVHRGRTGAGLHIEVAMADVATMLMTMNVTDLLNGGEEPLLRGNASSANAGYSLYSTSRGQLMLGAYHDEQQVRLWRSLEHPGIAAEVGGLSLDQLRARASSDRELLQTAFESRTADEWESRLASADVPAARVRGFKESIDETSLLARGVLKRFENFPSEGRATTVPVAGFRLSDGGPAAREPPPFVGQHTDAILSEFGFSDAEIAELRGAGIVA